MLHPLVTECIGHLPVAVLMDTFTVTPTTVPVSLFTYADLISPTLRAEYFCFILSSQFSIIPYQRT